MIISISRDGVEIGQWTDEQVRTFYKDGQLVPTDYYWAEGMAEWKPLSTFLKPPIPQSAGINPDNLDSYARSTLQGHETPLFKTTVHWVDLFMPACCTLVIALILLGITTVTFLFFPTVGLFIGIGSAIFIALIITPAIINYKWSEFVITDQRIIMKVGVLRRRTHEIYISKIESVGVDQSFWGRLFGYGSVYIRGTGGSADWFNFIVKPLEFCSCIQSAQKH